MQVEYKEGDIEFKLVIKGEGSLPNEENLEGLKYLLGGLGSTIKGIIRFSSRFEEPKRTRLTALMFGVILKSLQAASDGCALIEEEQNQDSARLS